MLRIKTISGHLELVPYANAIAQLISGQRYPALYLTFPYVFAWLKTFEEAQSALVIFCFEQDTLVGFAPFLVTGKEAKNAGDGLWGYSGIIWKHGYRDVVFEACVERLGQHGVERVEIGPIHEQAFEEYREYFHTLPDACLEELPGAPFIDTAVDKDVYIKSLPKAAYKDAARCERRLSDMGQLRMERITAQNGSNGVIEHAMDLFLEMYDVQWPQGRFIRDARWRDMYIALANACIETGLYLDFSLLILDEQVIAAHYGFIVNNRLYYFTPTYNTLFASLSPGKVLMKRLLDDSFERGMIFDFQNDAEEYKLLWTDKISTRHWLRFAVNGSRTMLHQSPSGMVYDQILNGIASRHFILGPDFVFRQGAISLKNPSRILLDVYKNVFFSSAFVKNISSALILGLGVGIVPTALHKLGQGRIEIDVVDINLEVIQIARNFFGLDPAVNLYHADAAVFVKLISKKYDYICVDIWDDKGVPDFVRQKWFWKIIFQVVNAGGAVSINASKAMHKEFCEIASQYADVSYSLAGNNTSITIPTPAATLDLNDSELLHTYAELGVDVETIIRNAVCLTRRVIPLVRDELATAESNAPTRSDGF